VALPDYVAGYSRPVSRRTARVHAQLKMFLAQFPNFRTCHNSATELRTVVWGCPWFDGRLNCDRNAFSSRYEGAIEFDDDTDCAPLNTTPPTIQKRSAFHLRAISAFTLLVSPVLLRPGLQKCVICISIGDMIGRRSMGRFFSYQAASGRVMDVSECFDNIESIQRVPARSFTFSHNPCLTTGPVRLMECFTLHHHNVWHLVPRPSGKNSRYRV